MGLREGKRITALVLFAMGAIAVLAGGCTRNVRENTSYVNGAFPNGAARKGTHERMESSSSAPAPDDGGHENGLGLTYERVTEGLLPLYEMQTGPVENGLSVEMGHPRAGDGLLKIVGPKSNVIQVSLTVPVSRAGKLNSAAMSRLQRVLMNLAPSWTDRDQWLSRAVGGATSMPGTRSLEEREGIQFEVTSPRMTEILTLTVRRR